VLGLTFWATIELSDIARAVQVLVGAGALEGEVHEGLYVCDGSVIPTRYSEESALNLH
jgi:predicted TIM-barrel enzyme